MSNITDIYYDVVQKVGEDKINKLLLAERAANQRHWAKRFRAGLAVKGYDYNEFRTRMSVVVDAMEKEADDYDPPRKT